MTDLAKKTASKPVSNLRVLISHKLVKDQRKKVRTILDVSNETYYKYLNFPELIPVGKIQSLCDYFQSIGIETDIYELTKTL